MDNLSYAEISYHALLHNTMLYRLGIHRISASQCLKADNLHDKKTPLSSAFISYQQKLSFFTAVKA